MCSNGKITFASHLSGAFCLVLQSRSYGYAPSSQDKNLSEICDPSVNKYWGTRSYLSRAHTVKRVSPSAPVSNEKRNP